MIQEIEMSSIDIRYSDYRLKNPGVEKKLLSSILDKGICEPLEGIDSGDKRILLNGFKRYRCAKRLGLGMVPYTSIGSNEAMGIIHLLRVSNKTSLSILEQSMLIDDLKKTHGMGVTDIANELSRSKAWVSVRLGIIGEMSETVRKHVFAGTFPVYSYMYTLRQFMRINKAKKSEIDEFVKSVAGKHLSIRDIERLAHGYFMGPGSFREQLNKGDPLWLLKQLKESNPKDENCNRTEQSMLSDLNIIQKYMQRFIHKSTDTRFKSRSFFSQANLLAGGILSKIKIFTGKVEEFYDRSRNTQSSISAALRRNEHSGDKPQSTNKQEDSSSDHNRKR